MSPSQALEILAEYSPPGEKWPLHCRQAGRVAALLCDGLESAGLTIDRALIESQTLLHDIGRSKTHGLMHGWTGFTLLRSLGHTPQARGCLTHWIKGRSFDEVVAEKVFEPAFVDKVFEALGAEEWCIGDSVVSVADSSVTHTTIVPIAQRHAELIQRYGDSSWVRRAGELAEGHAKHLEQHLKQPVNQLLAQLHGDTMHD